MKAKAVVVVLGALVLISVGAIAAKTEVFEFPTAGFRLMWDKGTQIVEREGKKDLIFEGASGPIALKAVIRRGERLPTSQHEFRLMSYFAGLWTKTVEDCRGSGWDGCASWTWDSEAGDLAGLGEIGYGPGGTYIFVLSAPEATFMQLRPQMRQVQQSIQLF